MGKITDDKINLTITVNGSAAKNELGKLEKEAVSLSKSYKDLILEKKKLNKTDKEYKSNLSSINKKLTETKIAVDQNKTAQDNLRKSIGLTGMTMNQLNKEAMKLRAMKANLTPGTEQFKKLNAELEATNAQMRKLKGNAQSGGGFFGKMADSFNKYQALALGATAAFAGVGLAIGGIVKSNAELSDSLADVRKTTGLTEEEVKRLNSQLKLIDTRSSRTELLGLARVAGKLGITGTKDVFEFVRAADQINVALAEDLGGNAEEAINSLGKLTELFNIKAEFGLEQGLLKTGSAINALGAASTASELYLVSFAKRMGGVGKQADVSLPNILGFGATLDQLGQTAEVSSTSLSKVWVNMFKDPGEYASIAKMSVEDFTTLLKTDANEAFIKFLEGLNGNNEGLSVMAQKMDGLGLDGARSVGVLSALAGNIELVRQQQVISNAEFDKGTSLTQEFNVKNNNLAGTLDKLGKRLSALFVNPKLNSMLVDITNSLYKWVKIPVDAALQKEREEVNRLVFALTKANTTEDDRRKILEELGRINPKIVEGLSAEKIETAKLVSNLRSYNEEMAKKIVLANLEESEQENAAKEAKWLEKRANTEYDLMMTLQKYDQQIALNSELTTEEKYKRIFEIMQEARKKEIAEGVQGEKIFNPQTEQYYYGQTQVEQDQGVVIAAYKSMIEYESKYQEALKNGVDFSERIAAIKKMLNITPVSAGPDLFSGSTATETSSYGGSGVSNDQQKELDKIKEYREEVLRNAMSLIEQERLAYDERLRQAGLFGKKQEDMTEEDLAVQKALLEQHLRNIRKINDDAFTSDITRMQEAFDLETVRRQTGYNEQLKIIGDNETEKAAFKQSFEKQEEERTRKHLESLLQILQDQMPSGDDFNIDLESAVLSDEAKAALLKKIEEVQLALASLGLPHADKKSEVEPVIKSGPKVDIFGMSQEDWSAMLLNLQEGKVELTEMLALAGAMSNAFAMINEIRANSEERSLIDFEKNIDSRKKTLDTLLKYNRISQERYNKRIAELDEELDAKKRKIAHDQAVRAKATAIFQAIISTATAVISALATPPPWLGIVLAALVGGMGALQIATIASEPVPQFSKGKYDVIGNQDGKTYSASVIDSPATGLIDSPAILVGEKPELIIDPATTKNLMVNYPSVIEAIHSARIPQFASGDYSSINSFEGSKEGQKLIAGVLAAQTASINRLNRNLEKGIQAKLLADDEYVRTSKDVNSRYDKLASKANSSL
jgi:TP901 family phage tail tape measure protein